MRNHHEQGPNCPLCNEKMLDAHPVIQAWFKRLKAEFPDVHTSWTFRDQASQDHAFKQGFTQVEWPRSLHNKKPARAFDVFQLREDKVAAWPWSYFRKLAAWLKEHGAPFTWGGEWKTIKDGDHFQLPKDIL